MEQKRKELLLLFSVLFISVLVACGSGNSNDTEKSSDGNAESENEDVNDSTESENEDVNDSTEPDHQTELSFGESGTVITGDYDESFQVEVTPKSVEFSDEYEDEYGKAEPWIETFVKYTAKIKNTDDKAFEINKIRVPSLAPWEDENEDFSNLDHQLAAFDEEIYLNGEKVTPEDEIAPGEEIEVISIFDTNESDKYYLQYGQAGEQIVTYAQWTIHKSDFK